MWIPGLEQYFPSGTMPKDPNPSAGASGGVSTSCYLYASDGVKYILSAYNTVEGGINTSKLYSDFGFRESYYTNSTSNDQFCVYTTWTGVSSIISAHQKSFTITNMAELPGHPTPDTRWDLYCQEAVAQ
ncbi:MAG: hypothetical protein NTZ87_03930 [Candidatus Nomurabacteria bacterium]|nr:hypothetical protein [Candidatus Nomurabacteria bacterium]